MSCLSYSIFIWGTFDFFKEISSFYVSKPIQLLSSTFNPPYLFARVNMKVCLKRSNLKRSCAQKKISEIQL